MKKVWRLIPLLCPLALAQTHGEDVFAKTCASGCCHGAGGTGAGAPRLAGRGFDRAFLTETITRGVPGTSMPAFAGSLSRQDLEAVVEYVAALNGFSTTPAKPAVFTGEAAARQDLFSDAVRGFGRCSTCHEVNGIGIPVACPIANVPADAQALRNLQTPAVRTATLGARTMPGLPVSNGSRATVF